MDYVIWWEELCGNSSYQDALWNSSLTVYTYNPEFTDCFQKTVMTWTPCCFLWIASIFYVPFLCRKATILRGFKISLLNFLKLASAVILAIVSLSDLIWFVVSSSSSSSSSSSLPPVDYISPIIRLLSYVMAAVLTHVTFRKAIHSSGVLFIFWLLQVLCGSSSFRSMFLKPTTNFSMATTSISFIFTLLSFIFFHFSDLLPAEELEKIHGVASADDQQQEQQFSSSSSSASRSRDANKFNIMFNDLNSAKPRADSEPLCPKLTAPFLSVVLFLWFFPKVIKGWRRTLTNSDIWRIRREDSCSTIYPAFEENWNKAKQENLKRRSKRTNKESESLLDGSRKHGKLEASLVKTLFNTFYGYLIASGALQLFSNIVIFINPFILNYLLAFVSNKQSYTWHGFVLAIVMLTSSIIGLITMHHYLNLNYSVGMRVKTALTCAIYRKSLTISPYARRSTTTGEIINLMSVDAQKVADSLPFIHYIWSSPLVFIAAIACLWQILGPSTLTGMVFMLIVLPVNSGVMAKLIREFQRVQMALKDARLKLMNQILMGIKILKLYAWEPYFTAKILEIREKELKNLRKSQTVGAVTYILWFCSSFLVALLCFATFVLSSSENVLDAQTAFVSLSFIMLMSFPLTILAPSIMLIVQAGVSLKRIENFLLQDDVDDSSVTHYDDAEFVVDIRNGEFSWVEDDQKSTLNNINLQINEGELVAVVGTVGCGKSSLLSAMLGEIRKKGGSVNLKGKLAYVAQQAWIQNMSVKENILFNQPYNPLRYSGIIDACALRPDLDILPAGDNTEIGERGINLSGGQKQRISLARAVYQDAEVYLLDDTLSAVDAHVSKHIFDAVIGATGLLKKKTRILVTHSVSLLSKVDRIVVIGDGCITEQGTFDELIVRNGEFAEFIKTYMVDLDEKTEDDEDKQALLKLQRQLSVASDEEKEFSDGESFPAGSPKDQAWRMRRKRSMSVQPEVEKKSGVGEKLIQEETAEEGNVKMSVITSYVRSAPIIYPILLIISFISFVAFFASTNIWLSQWADDPIINGTQDPQLTKLRLGVYGALGAGQTLSVVGLILSIIFGCIQASRSLHTGLIENVVRYPMSFFETIPLGRILNRFSKDIDTIDTNIPQFSQNLITTLCPLVSTLFIIGYTIPPFIGVVIPLLLLFAFLQRVYISCARQIKRIDSVLRSPIYAFFSETLNGSTSIRAFKQQGRFVRMSDTLLDNSQRVWFEVFSSNRWIGVWSEFIADMMVFFTTIFAIIQRDTLDPSLVGLCVSFAFQINMSIIMTVRSSCELETYIVAAERIKEYSEMPTEAPWTVEGGQVAEKWPHEGRVVFNNYSTRYREGLDLVLKDISVSVNSTEKVGIVGRTGAGKSSMTVALFRIIEAAGGNIVIDDQDISKLGLHDVRQKLTVIPQDPILFSGSLRFNLDPASQFTDHEIWQALEQAHLKNFILSLPDKIDHECGEDGANLSVGQRQLVCLARALLRKSKILVLDEATAAVDLETDDLIQSTIRSQFQSCTVMTIAHRINTILDYDRILVLEKGEVKEFGSPAELLQDNQSSFYFLAKDAGLV